MSLAIDSLDRSAAHAPRVPAKTVINTAPATGQPTTQAQDSSTPSFSAVFAQIAATAAAAGTTVASIAPAPGTTGAAGVTTQAAGVTTSAAATTPEDTAGDPAGPLFGANPWMTDPTGQGPGGVVTHYNPVYFATQQTAETVAQMVGGTVTQSVQITKAPGTPFGQDELNYMVQLPNGGQVNPGLIADLYTHGWNQALVNQQVANEVAGAQPSQNT